MEKKPEKAKRNIRGVEEKGKGIKERRGMVDVYLYQLH